MDGVLTVPLKSSEHRLGVGVTMGKPSISNGSRVPFCLETSIFSGQCIGGRVEPVRLPRLRYIGGRILSN